MDQETISSAARSLLKQAEWSTEEVARRLELAFDADYWRSLAPFTSVEGAPREAELGHVDDEAVARECRRLARDGYFRLTGVFAPATMDRLHRTIAAVRSAGWPATFAFVYDDFWRLAGCRALEGFLTAALGADYRQNTVIWAHWVMGEAGHSGWHPHHDLLNQGEKFLSLWIAVSEATTDNGCMFLVRGSAMTPEIAQAIRAQQALPYGSYRRLLNNAVALPVKAGAIVGWRGDVIHWGGINTGGASPRVSLALELRSHDARPTAFESPLIDPRAAPPPLRLRLAAVAKALLEYQKFEPDMSRYRSLGEQIRQATSPPS